jgi:glutamyl-tRNA(Gln) amidotransferase subunit E
MIHGDEDFEKYGVDKNAVEKELKAGLRSSYAILIGDFDEKMRLAFQSVVERAYMKKIPSETRKPLKNGESQFMRPMPTGARMYPETDVEPIIVTEDLIRESEKYAPRNPEDVLRELEGQTNKDLAPQLLRSPHLGAYQKAVGMGVDAKVAAVTFVSSLKTISREGIPVDRVDEGQVIEVLQQYAQNKITKKAIEEVIRELCKNPKGEIGAVIKGKGLEKITGAALKKIIEEEGGDAQKILAKYRLRIEAEELLPLIKKQ